MDSSIPRAEPLVDEYATCAFCRTIEENVKWGQKYRLIDLVMHNNCALLAKSAVRIGKKTDGARGATYQDVKKSLRTAAAQQCAYCDRFGAATVCHTCRICFHLPCGSDNGAVSVCKGHFLTYCGLHRPVQKIPRAVVAEARSDPPDCIMCAENIDVDNDFTTLWAPCCNKLFHRNCVQTMASHSGAALKCPTCNNIEDFEKEIVNHGIFVQKRAPSWEADDVPNVYYITCDAHPCLCAFGNTYNDDGTPWQLILCSSCAARGTHVICSLVRDPQRWECDGCFTAGQVARANRV